MRKSSKTNKAICKTCGKEFMTLKSEFCSSKCRNIDYAKQDSEKLDGVEGEDFIVCKWCGLKVKRIYGSHLKTHHPGKTTTDYKNDFPGAPLACSKDNKNVAKAYIRFTQSNEGRNFLSERVKGQKNPNSKERASEKVRKSRSPFSVEFYLKRGFTEEEAKSKISVFASDMAKERLTETQLEYWVQRTDGNIELAKELLRSRQRTFTLQKCILRYGEEEGTRRWKERQIKWSEKWKIKYKNGDFKVGTGNSKISKELFNQIKNSDSIYGNKEWWLRLDKNIYFYDFCDKKRKKIIEFNGDFWHCNPEFFSPDFFHPVKKQTAHQIWGYDKKKELIAKESGYDYLLVWEKEYRQNPHQVVKKCKQFLES